MTNERSEFTNDDLLWFNYKFGHLSHCAALIARLEAAEVCAEKGRRLAALLDSEGNESDLTDWDRKCDAWRKAAGK